MRPVQCTLYMYTTQKICNKWQCVSKYNDKFMCELCTGKKLVWRHMSTLSSLRLTSIHFFFIFCHRRKWQTEFVSFIFLICYRYHEQCNWKNFCDSIRHLPEQHLCVIHENRQNRNLLHYIFIYWLSRWRLNVICEVKVIRTLRTFVRIISVDSILYPMCE